MANGTLAASQIEMLSQSGTGIITITPPATNTNRAITLPDAAGAIVVSGTTPSLNGITFPATQVASADANTLDDYEEGTWTPAYNTTNSNISGVGYFRRYGFYTKVGNVVTVTFSMATTGAAGISGTGSVTLTGLPFAVSLVSGDFFAASVSSGRFTSNRPSFVNASSTNATELILGTEIGTTELTIANFDATNTNNFNITTGSFSYRVA
jgi:hypothetical protein